MCETRVIAETLGGHVNVYAGYRSVSFCKIT